MTPNTDLALRAKSKAANLPVKTYDAVRILREFRASRYDAPVFRSVRSRPNTEHSQIQARA